MTRYVNKLACCRWSRKWLVMLNSSKCKAMHITHSLGTVYHLNNDTGNSSACIIRQLAEEKDLDVHLTEDLKSSRGPRPVHSVACWRCGRASDLRSRGRGFHSRSGITA